MHKLDGIVMSMDGIPDISGTTWWSRDGSKHFVVRDIVSDGSQMIVRTDSGEMIPFDTLQNFIQSETPIKIPKVNPKMGKINIGQLDETTPVQESDDDLLLPEDKAMLGFIDIDGLEKPETPRQFTPPTTKNPNYDIIDKALSKVDAPTCWANIKWNAYPSRELELLMDIMDIPATDIAEYIYGKWFDGNVKNMIIRQIKEELGDVEES